MPGCSVCTRRLEAMAASVLDGTPADSACARVNRPCCRRAKGSTSWSAVTAKLPRGKRCRWAANEPDSGGPRELRTLGAQVGRRTSRSLEANQPRSLARDEGRSCMVREAAFTPFQMGSDGAVRRGQRVLGEQRVNSAHHTHQGVARLSASKNPGGQSTPLRRHGHNGSTPRSDPPRHTRCSTPRDADGISSPREHEGSNA